MDRPVDQDPVALAVSLFQRRFTCGQALLAAFAGRHGLDRDTALRLACAFGGGIARTGRICGAVSGALMVIGLVHGCARAEDRAARDRTYGAARTFLDRFRAEHGSELCRELLELDIGCEEGYAAAVSAGLFTTRCPEIVRSAARIVSTLL